MTTKAIVEDFDLLKQVGLGLGVGEIKARMDQLDLPGAEETFDRGVIRTNTGSAHTSHDVIICQQRLVIVAGILVTTIGMMDRAGADES